MGNLPTPEEQAAAFEAAVRELSRAYPPPPVSSVAYAMAKRDGQIKAHKYMVDAASKEDFHGVRMWCSHTRIPRNHLEAIIALIYG